jgi:AraC-like DNA-binding protein
MYGSSHIQPPVLYAEIVRVKISRAKLLLLETDLSVAAIARLAGFEHPE